MRCSMCGSESARYDKFLDLSLFIGEVGSLEVTLQTLWPYNVSQAQMQEALSRFFCLEVLENDNGIAFECSAEFF